MSESEGSSRAVSEAPLEAGVPELSSSAQDSNIITDLPVMHTAKRLKIEARKLDGMQRELYSLIGDNAPPVVVTPSSKFKTRPGWQQRAAAWKLVDFSPKDGLSVKHWVRATAVADGTAGNRFARFNTGVNVPSWSDSNYIYFQSDDWSLEETRYLFDLAREFDVRWLVIADRYNFEGGKPRSVEDLKERYYEVCSALIKNRAISADLGLSPYDEERLNAMKFDKEAEQQRKAQLERLLSRTPKEVAEEEALILEARRLESMGDKIFAERKALMDLLESPAPLNAKSTKADLGTSQGVGQLLQELQNEKSRKPPSSSTASAASSPAPAPAGGAHSAAQQAVRNVLSRVFPPTTKITPREEMAIGITYLDTAAVKHPGVYLRSAKISPIRQNLLAKVRAVTNELELPVKPVMPTAKTCAKYEQLYQSITILLEAKKIQDKLEMEIDVLKRAKEAQKHAKETDGEKEVAEEDTKEEAN